MKNIPFALAADSLFTNYRWTIKSLKEAASTGERHGLHPTETAFGVDVWAQNTNMPGPPRITFPQHGGGGTNTGLVSSRAVVFLWANLPSSKREMFIPGTNAH